ncbi:8011_t:CDS:2, partial [Entrophospora sp. SA101]
GISINESSSLEVIVLQDEMIKLKTDIFCDNELELLTRSPINHLKVST